MDRGKVSPEGRGGRNALRSSAKTRANQRVNSPATDPEERRTRYQMFMDGDLEPADFTLDELTRGHFMDRNGSFTGRAPAKMDRAVYQAFTRELQRRMNGRFQQYAIDAIETIAEVMFDGEGEQISQFQKRGTKRLDAAKYIVERVMGKIPDKLEVTAEITTWQSMEESGTLFVDIGEIDAQEVREAEDVPVSSKEPEVTAPRRISARAARARGSNR